MKSESLDIFVYDQVSMKKANPNDPQVRTPEEALIFTLDLMDFNAALTKAKTTDSKIDANWIILEING